MLSDGRFWSHVEKLGLDDCWLWGAARLPNGYGKLNRSGKMWLAHRYAYSLMIGTIPSGLHVCHHCDNRLCVNPTHLFVGSRSDNIQDMLRKGRGGGSVGSRFSDKNVAEVRRRFDEGDTIKHLASAFATTAQYISAIVRGKHWKHVSAQSRTKFKSRRAVLSG